MNKKIEENFKPRTWLLIILIIIGLVITVLLANKLLVDHNKRKAESKSIFDIFTSALNDESNQKDNLNDDFDNEYDKIKKEMEEEEAKWEIEAFNQKFETHSGTTSGFFIVYLLDDVITNNKTKKDHIIQVSYGNTETQEEEAIRTIKSNFTKQENQHVNYEVILDYDENGYVNKITIR